MLLNFADLKYYAIPSLPDAWIAPNWLKIEVGLFSGRLYFDFAEYEDLCTFLGIGNERLAAGTTSASFTSKPLTFLQDWLSLRRKGQDFAHTPMGHVCQGKLVRI